VAVLDGIALDDPKPSLATQHGHEDGTTDGTRSLYLREELTALGENQRRNVGGDIATNRFTFVESTTAMESHNESVRKSGRVDQKTGSHASFPSHGPGVPVPSHGHMYPVPAPAFGD
jgi:hypothetical protein